MLSKSIETINNRVSKWLTTGKYLSAKRQLVGSLGVLAALGILLNLESPLALWTAAVLPAVVIGITAVARAHDAKGWELHQIIRRFAFLLALLAVGRLGGRMILEWDNPPDWGTIAGLWAWGLSWFTTPNTPPWWDYISGKKKPNGPI